MAALHTGAAEARTRRRRRHRRRPPGRAAGTLRADVVVVGAGLAGLIAARDLVKTGRSVLVMEARSRVGGRTLSQTLGSGAFIEHGGAYLFSEESEHVLVGLAKDLGIGTYPVYRQGDNVYHRRGVRETYPRNGPAGRVPPDPTALPDLLVASKRLDDMAAQVRPDAPWTVRSAADWDGQTFHTWLVENTTNENSRLLLGSAVQILMSKEPRDVSLLSFLAILAGTGMTLQEVTESAATSRFAGGAQEISVRLAEHLDGRVLVSTPVRQLVQDASGVRAISDRTTVVAAQAIVAVPPFISAYVRYDPPLPPLRAQLTQRFPPGSVIRCHTVYDHAFWRDDGLTGESFADFEPVRYTQDASLPGGRPGILASYIDGSWARRWCERSADDRRAAVLSSLTTLFGRAAGSPIDYVEKDWSTEEWTRGCSYGVPPAGVLIDYGPALRAPVGRIHWSGTETATEWAASMEGAVRSGMRAAADVLAVL